MKVKKSLSPEELTLINNIEAIVSELKQTAGGASSEEEAEEAMKAEPKVGDQKPNPSKENEEEAMKAEGEIEPDGDEYKEKENFVRGEKSIDSAKTDAPELGDAEAQLEDLPENDEEAIAEVVKSVLAARKARKIAKMAPKDAAVVKALQTLSAEISTLRKSVAGVIEGTGLADQMLAGLEVAKSQKIASPAPVQNSDMSALISALQNMSGVQKSQNAMPPREEVRKSLGEAMFAVLGGAENTIRK